MSHSCFETWHLDLQELLGPRGSARCNCLYQPRSCRDRANSTNHAAKNGGWPNGSRCGELRLLDRGHARGFRDEAEDHGNCSVGSLTHGFKTMEEIAQNADVAALCETGWVTPEAVAKIAVVREKPTSMVYGPLRDMPVEPSVILLRLNGKQQMLLHDAWPGLRFEGKPQCHIIPIAKESGEIAVSVGCMLSRVRTGMSNNEVTCAIPASRMSLLIERLRAARAADNAVAAYAAEDSKRFGRQQ